jgi:hypothetical protein
MAGSKRLLLDFVVQRGGRLLGCSLFVGGLNLLLEDARRPLRGAGVGQLLTGPCDGFEKISAAFPTYTMLDNSPDGHAVVMMKVCSVLLSLC